MTTRQAGLSRLRFSIKQTNTSWRFGIADQHTLNASPIQAPRSSEVSATAAEQKKALTKAAVTGITAFIDVDVFKIKPPGKLRTGAHCYVYKGSGPSRRGCGFSARLMNASSRTAPARLPERHHKASFASHL